MATTVTTTKNLRYHMALRNGGTRYFDIENPITDTSVISSNINEMNSKVTLPSSFSGSMQNVLVAPDYFTGDTDAVVTAITSAEVIETQKTVTTTNVFTS